MFHSRSFVAAGLVLTAVFFASRDGCAAAVEHVVDGVFESVWVPASVQTVAIYQGSVWVWSPALGWQRQDRWLYVPRLVPGHWENRVRMLNVFLKRYCQQSSFVSVSGVRTSVAHRAEPTVTTNPTIWILDDGRVLSAAVRN